MVVYVMSGKRIAPSALLEAVDTVLPFSLRVNVNSPSLRVRPVMTFTPWGVKYTGFARYVFVNSGPWFASLDTTAT